MYHVSFHSLSSTIALFNGHCKGWIILKPLGQRIYYYDMIFWMLGQLPLECLNAGHATIESRK